MQQFTCPHCNLSNQVDASSAGRRIACQQCGKYLKVPGVATSSHGRQDAYASEDELFEDDIFIEMKESSPTSATDQTPTETSESPDDHFSLAPETRRPDRPRPEIDFDVDLTGSNESDQQNQTADSLEKLGSANETLGHKFDLKMADSTSSPRKPSQTGSNELDPNSEFTLKCPVCDSLWHVKVAQIGQTIQCGDCLSDIIVRKPARKDVSKPTPLTSGDGMALEQAAERTVVKELWQKTAEEQMKQAEEKIDRNATDFNRSKPTAPTSYEESPPGIKTTLLLGLKVFVSWDLLPLFGLLNGATFCFIFLINAGIQSAGSSGMGQFISLACFGASSPFLLVALVAGSVLVVTVMQETTNGYDKIKNVPAFSIQEWSGLAVHTLCPMIIGLVPGCFVANLFIVAGGPPLIGSMFILLTFPALYSAAQMSVFHNNTPWLPFSPTVFQSFSTNSGPWLQYVGLSTAILMMTSLTFLQIPATHSFVTASITLSFCTAALFNSRLLGLHMRTVFNVNLEEEEDEETDDNQAVGKSGQRDK